MKNLLDNMVKLEELFNKTLECVSKLDKVILSKVEHYEKYHNLEKLKRDLHSFILLYDDYKFNIVDIRSNKFELDYLIYLDEHIISINMSFSENNDYIFFMYNNIYLLSNHGEVLHEWTNDIMMWLNEE